MAPGDFLQADKLSGKEHQIQPKEVQTILPQDTREFLLEKWGGKCAYCGKSNRILIIEHIIPKCRGGDSTLSNLTLSCYDCNITKAGKTALEFGHPEVQQKAISLGRTTKITGRDTKILNLCIVELMAIGKTPTQIHKELGISQTALQYHLNQLKSEGAIRKLGYGTWEVTKGEFYVPKRTSKTLRVTTADPQTKLSCFAQDSVRGHAFTFTLKIPKGLRNWNNEKRERYLKKNNIEFKRLTTYGGGQRIISKGRKTWLMNKSIIIYEKDSYLAETAEQSKSHAIYNFIQKIKSLERLLKADFTIKAGSQYKFKVSRQHYALVKNALARQYNEANEKLEVYTEKGLWFLIDNSFNLDEAETVHPETAETDNVKVQNFFNSLKDQPNGVTIGELLELSAGIQQNQLLFSKNALAHVDVIRELGLSVQGLNELLRELKEVLKK